MIARVATAETLPAWLALARRLTVRELQTAVARAHRAGEVMPLEDGGPALYVQTRVGKWGRHFNMFKFRSMYVDADQRLEELLSQNHHRE